MTPYDARKPKSELEVKHNVLLNAKFDSIDIGDKVKIYTKKKQFAKEHVPAWSKIDDEVENIDETRGQLFLYIN